MPETRMNEKPLFIEGDGCRIFAFLHAPECPAGERRGGIVFCNAMGLERVFSIRHLVEWARFLALKGYHVLRFDYRDQGDSDYDGSRGITIRHYLEDLDCAVGHLRSLGLECVAIFGLRMGALIALGYQRGSGEDRDLILWEPILVGKEYNDFLLLEGIAGGLINTEGKRKTRKELREELLGGEGIDINGFFFRKSLYESLDGLNFLDGDAEGRDGAIRSHRIVISQFGSKGEGLRKKYAKFRDRLAGSSDVRIEPIAFPPFWLRIKEYEVRPLSIFEKNLELLGRSADRDGNIRGSVERP
jgi:pimeloyl-ACP methyl ester carboxylesterase